MVLNYDQIMSNEHLGEVFRLQELHRKNALDIRRFKAKTFMNDNQVLDEVDKLLNKLENRSKAALTKTKER
jgi:hypothetical protein